MTLKYLLSLGILISNGTLSLASCKNPDVLVDSSENIPSKKYYVAIDGNDSNTGNIYSPFRTISNAIAHTLPGDTVFIRKGIYHEKVLITNSGKKNKPIVLMSYPTETVSIDGDGLPISGTEALLTIRNANAVQVEGLIFQNFRSSAKAVDVNGIIVDQGSKNIIIRNNIIRNIENNASAQDGRSGHGILIIGNTDQSLTNIIVEDNQVYNCNTGYSENITINGYVDGFVVRRNKVYNGENIGIVAAGGYAANANPTLNYVRNGLISENEVYDIDGTRGPVPAFEKHNGAIGIYIDGARNIIVEKNRVYHCGRGIGLVSETDNFPTLDCIVRNNLVYENSLAGISLGGYLNYTGGGTISCYIVNNTLFHNSQQRGYFDEFEGEIRLVENCIENVIENNVIYTTKDRPFINKYTTSGRENRIDYNLYYTDGSNTWIWAGKILSTPNQWRSCSQGDLHANYNLNPLFTDPDKMDFRAEKKSPVIKTGHFISQQINGNQDLLGKSRSHKGILDKGAYQN